MEESDKLVIQRSTQFFATSISQFVGFSRQMNNERIDPKKIKQVSLKCYGHGYFPMYKDQIKANLLSYIKACMSQCADLTIFKLILNGFDVADNYLSKILKEIKSGANNNEYISAIWVHTNHLTSCTLSDFNLMLDLIQQSGTSINREQISIQMTHWTFQRPPAMYAIVQSLTKFIEGASQMGVGLQFKKFRLEISSWYLKTDEAYLFLRSGMSNEDIVKKLNLKVEEANNKALNFLNSTANKKYSDFSGKQSVIEREIKKLTNRGISEEVVYHIVQYFHSQIVYFVSQLLAVLHKVEDFTLDFRNWNGMFKMSELNNKLQSKSGPRSEFSMIYKRGSSANRLPKPEELEEERILRTTYLF